MPPRSEASVAELGVELATLAQLLHQRSMEELQELGAVRGRLAEQELQLSALKGSLSGAVGAGEEVIDINAGGQVHSILRSTLCMAEGSMLASLFSGRWEMLRDTTGRPFLDVDPHLFQHVLAFLRLKRMLGPDEDTPLPEVETHSRQAFCILLRYYGLNDYVGMYPDSLSCFTPSLKWPLRSTSIINPCGYLIRFDEPVRLSAVFVGFSFAAECSVIVGIPPLNLLREVFCTARSCAGDSHVTHVAEGFDLRLEPPEAFIMARCLSEGKTTAKSWTTEPQTRVVGPFRVSNKMKLPPEDDVDSICMTILWSALPKCP